MALKEAEDLKSVLREEAKEIRRAASIIKSL